MIINIWVSNISTFQLLVSQSSYWYSRISFMAVHILGLCVLYKDGTGTSFWKNIWYISIISRGWKTDVDGARTTFWQKIWCVSIISRGESSLHIDRKYDILLCYHAVNPAANGYVPNTIVIGSARGSDHSEHHGGSFKPPPPLCHIAVMHEGSQKRLAGA